jgi:hypothetical protein
MFFQKTGATTCVWMKALTWNCWPRHSSGGSSPASHRCGPGFETGPRHVGFCDGQKWRWGRFSARTSVSPANLHSICSPQSSSLSPEAGTIGQEWPQCQSSQKPNNTKKKYKKKKKKRTTLYCVQWMHWPEETVWGRRCAQHNTLQAYMNTHKKILFRQ